MARIKVQKVPKTITTPGSLLASLCYYYPQYTLQEARKLPYRHVVLLLNTARRLKAGEYLNLVQIATAPHTKKGQGVKELITFYKDITNG